MFSCPCGLDTSSRATVSRMGWRWTYEGSGDPAGSAEFPSQADAEAWLGDAWRELGEQGVTAVTLEEDGRVAYGPMSLAPE